MKNIISFFTLMTTTLILFSLRRKRRISHAPSEFSTKENTFGVPLEGWKKHAMNQGFESKRQHTGIVPTIVGEV